MQMNNDIFYNKLKGNIKRFNEIKYNFNVWIIANVAETVQSNENFIQHTNFSEFFTKAEFASIISAITSIFGYVRIFYSEIEFLNYVLENKKTLDTSNIIIYNFSRDGIKEGKKSLIPSFCDLFNLNYIGSNPFVISLLRNKFIYTKFLDSMGIPVPSTVKYHLNGKFSYENFQDKDKLIVKNVYESASIGMSEKNLITYCEKGDISPQLDKLCEEIKADEVLVQEYICGKECEVFVIKYHETYYAFPPVKLTIHDSDIITHKISDEFDYSFSPLSADFSEDICTELRIVSENAAELLGIKNYARLDFRITPSGEFYLFDIAGTPYLTRHSSIAFLFTQILNMQYTDIFILLAVLAEADNHHDVNCKSDSNSPREE